VWVSSFDGAGRVFEIEAELRSSSGDAIVYGGRACSDGKEVMRMTNCIGPMLPMEDFDDPESVRRRFVRLREHGEQDPLAPDTLDGPSMTVQEHEPGKWIRADLDVPSTSPFFADHFPRKPVLPASILLHYEMRLGFEAAREALGREPGARVKESRIRGMKIRQFTAPGTRLDLEARITSAAGNEALAALTIRRAVPDAGAADDDARRRPLGTARLEVVLDRVP
jgi:3-hydroxymyristoyl/3-hydroxydecanoyl-(acyl carrier protein) dehydratase